MSYEKEVIDKLAAKILASGFRVFVAERGTYGFYTDADGTRVVSFQVDLGNPRFSGNYKTDRPTQTGTGWQLTRQGFQEMFDQYPPRWAVGDAKWSFTTLDQHLKTYQPSSRYTEIETVKGATA